MAELEDEAASDPFSPEEAPGLSLIMQMRIYDVLMAMYMETNMEAAKDLLEMHSRGQILGPLPSFYPEGEDEQTSTN